MSVNTEVQTNVPLKNSIIPSGTALIWVVVFGVLAAVGLFAAGTILVQGQSSLAATNLVPWNIFVSAYVFFVVTSTGLCFISAFGHVVGIHRYEIISKRAVTMSLIMLAVGMMAILLDIGRPLMMINMLFSPNPTSPMFWMGLLYGVYGFLLVMELISIIKGNHKATKIWGTLGVLSALVAHGTLGALFGMLYARDLWYGEYMPIYFILSAFVSGLAALSLFIFLSYGSQKKYIPYKLEGLLSEIGRILAYALGALLFFIFWKSVAGLYAGKVETQMLLFGEYAVRFWVFEVIIGILVPMFILANKSMRTKGGIVLSAILVLTGLVMARLNLVIVGQLSRPFEQGLASYSANALEIMFFAGLFGIAGLLYMIASTILKFEKYEEKMSKQ
ncbi:polysulfide reductase NrfD [Anaerobacillus sp. CMMVII]|uniref:NrfD/PsrC family molybdoenzyme membrane anchor subunit n=1 Tax=Anaerobacillus sp. CMMVII TaxID=2755588 RepID=UPI0021B729A8|nr:NrfD/PsrC family molybdoenzyme membrane anchor subunit [Anaerobacillus sp. CMMVII]MCT8137016.1 polysulfide reductase NrfD [Anaerobacillus sp. CMMVII]